MSARSSVISGLKAKTGFEDPGESRGQFSPICSFRDPGGAVLATTKQVFRAVNAPAMEHLEAFLSSRAGDQWISSGRVPSTRAVNAAECRRLLEDPRLAAAYDSARASVILEHERIPFPSFPYEWPPEMLHAAAELTLNFALDLLPEGLGLKDATPYNVLFRGPDPVFVDLLSVERRRPGDAIWLPYAQFVRTFLFPLLAHRHFRLQPDQALISRRDGLEPEEVYAWLRGLQKLRPPFLSLVSLPTWLGSGRKDDAALYRHAPLRDPAKAEYIIHSLLAGLQKTLRKAAPRGSGRSAWAGYMQDDNNNYTPGQFEAKERFIRRVLSLYAPQSLLDVGCNTGHFSLIAARTGSRVVAIDYDPVVIGSLWRKAYAERLPVLPLVVNLARPTPGMGWLNSECPSFLDRAQGSFDAVFMLAVVHHMLVTERVPLSHIVEIAAELTTDLLVIEFVAPGDSMFQRLLRGREDLHRDLDAAAFENAFQQRFDIIEAQQLDNSFRSVYLMRRKAAHS